MAITLNQYYNRYSKLKKWARMLFRSGNAIQAAEGNELQDIFAEKLKRLGDSLFSDGEIRSGCDCTVAKPTDLDLTTIARLGSGTIYLDGEVREVEAKDLSISATGTVLIGVIINSEIVTELEDKTLNSPAKGLPDYGYPGAARLVVSCDWATDTTAGNGPEDKFYPVYTIIDGELQTAPIAAATTDTVSDSFKTTLAQYDKEAHGNFVYEGLSVRALEPTVEGTQVFSIAAGHAHIDGYEVTLPHSVRLTVDEEADEKIVTGEPHSFNGDNNNSMVVDLNHTPVAEVTGVGVTVQVTETITHGSYSGCVDPLANNSVVKIMSVSQGSTVYTQGTDFFLSQDKVDWSSSERQNEPSPGSTYQVTYQYWRKFIPTDYTNTGLTLSGVVEDSITMTDYKYRLIRKDLIVIDKTGTVSRIKGVSHPYSPVEPDLAPGQLCLAVITQEWNGLPKIINKAVKAVAMSTLQAMQEAILNNSISIANHDLQFEADASAPSAVHGRFVDSFLNDAKRDSGIAQTAIVEDGLLMLPMSMQNLSFESEGNVPALLDFSSAPVLSQTSRTGDMRVNPYQAFDPIPSKLTLSPSVDRWTSGTKINTIDGGTVRRGSTVVRGGHFATYSESRIGTEAKTISTVATVDSSANLRQINITVTAKNLGPGEIFNVYFDDIRVISNAVASAKGEYTGVFKIPAGIPSGTKKVELRGISGAGSKATATFIGTAQIITTTIRRTTYITTTTYVDPLAQTFVLDESRHVSGVDLFFTRLGNKRLQVQIREADQNGPTTTILAEGEAQPNQLAANAINRINFDYPVFLNAGQVYALVILTDSPDYAVAIAELSKWDTAAGKWVTSQPYQTGVLFSSSNAFNWTVHQDADLWFRLHAADFINGKKVITLGSVDLTNVSDLMPLAEVETTGMGTDVTFVLFDRDGVEAARVQPNQLLELSERLSGLYTLKAELSGNAKQSPVLHPGVQLVTGNLLESGDYVGRAFVCGTNKKIYVTLDQLTPGSSNIKVSLLTGDNTWTVATVSEYEEIGNGWRSVTYECPCGLAQTRVKIELSGNASERPYAANLKVVVCDAI